MIKKILILNTFLFILIILFGCVPQPKFIKTEMDQLFEKDFVGLDIPEINKIKVEGKNKDYPYTNFDEVWDSVIIILMQEGFIVHLSKDSGIIAVVPPQQIKVAPKGFYYYTTGQSPLFEAIALLIEKREEVTTVYLKCMEDLNRKVNKPEEKVGFTADEEKIAEIFFGKLATQIYSSQKWKYLYKQSKN